MADQIRNKYNTLTPAEAKKLNRYLAQRTPIRTASVLNKPRAPPIVVTNLDDDGADNNNHQLNTTTAAADDQDRTITNNNESEPEFSNQRCRQLNYHHHDSLSNLSFRSSRDTPDCATIQRSFQTMSVDLSARNHQSYRLPPAYDPTRHLHQQQRMLRNLPKRSNTLNTRISDDSFSSAKSDFFNVSGRSSSVTPTKFTRFPPTNSVSATPEPIRSASKPSLSSSTYKVLQSPLANFKRLFRGIQRPFSQAASHQRASAASAATRQQVASTKTSTSAAATKRQQQRDSSLADLSLSDSISCVSLNKSQSPTVLPPPPSELKSLGYLESSCVDYSNYDDFTKTRNERLLRPTNSRPNSRSNESGDLLQQLSFGKSDDSDDSSWQMTSLPVYFERNLTTVFEERHHNQQQQQPPPAPPVLTAEQLAIKLEARQRRRLTQIISPPLDSDSVDSRAASNHSGCEQIYQSIKPPRRFDDSSNGPLVVDPSLELQRRQPASPFRFSFGQPLSFVTDNQTPANTNLGLPPRLPTGQQQQQQQQKQQQSSQQHQLMPTNHSKINSEIQSRHHDNSSSGNSSNCSSQMNVINYCDRQDSSTTATTGKSLVESTNSAYSLEAHHDLYGNLDDPNSTLQSESSTIRSESNLASFYANKFAEFERTVASLKNKLIVKEKELTELQLVQLNSDYTIERIKERLVKLERENQQLRAMTNGNPSRDTVYC